MLQCLTTLKDIVDVAVPPRSVDHRDVNEEQAVSALTKITSSCCAKEPSRGCACSTLRWAAGFAVDAPSYQFA